MKLVKGLLFVEEEVVDKLVDNLDLMVDILVEEIDKYYVLDDLHCFVALHAVHLPLYYYYSTFVVAVHIEVVVGVDFVDMVEVLTFVVSEFDVDDMKAVEVVTPYFLK